MQHKRKISDISDGTEDGTFMYGFDDLNEAEDEPISIRTGLSMPAWKTPSTIHAYSSEAVTERPISPTLIESVSPDTDSLPVDFFEFERPEEPEASFSADDARAAIRKERPVRISVWKRFTAWVERLIPSFTDESFLSRLNLYLGGLAFVIVLIIFVVVLFVLPS